MDIYQVIVVGLYKLVRFEVMATGIIGAWAEFEELLSSDAYPTGVGPVIEVRITYLKPLQDDNLDYSTETETYSTE